MSKQKVNFEQVQSRLKHVYVLLDGLCEDLRCYRNGQAEGSFLRDEIASQLERLGKVKTTVIVASGAFDVARENDEAAAIIN